MSAAAPTLPHLLTIVEQFWHREPGGTALATEQTLSALASAGGFRITGLAARHSPPDQALRAPWQRMPAGSTLQFERLPRPALYEGWLRFGRPSIDRYADDDTVVWAASTIVPPTGQPVVATVHDLDFLDHPERVGRRGRQFFPLMWDRARDRADLVVCPSQHVADACCRHGLAPSRVAVVPWGVAAPPCDRGEAAVVLAELGLRPGYVLWVGDGLPARARLVPWPGSGSSI